MVQLFWLYAYLFFLCLHYIGTVAVLIIFENKFLTEILLISNYWFKQIILYSVFIVVWVSLGLLFKGCPFTYLEEYALVKAGKKEKITYKFEKSTAYRFVIKPLAITLKRR